MPIPPDAAEAVNMPLAEADIEKCFDKKLLILLDFIRELSTRWADLRSKAPLELWRAPAPN
jgi:hypothetical protein